jgi:hypothetical protein
MHNSALQMPMDPVTDIESCHEAVSVQQKKLCLQGSIMESNSCRALKINSVFNIKAKGERNNFATNLLE